MSRHTPGPWVVVDSSSDGGWFVGESANLIVCGRAPWPNRAAESLANARLIAAAPKMLEALRKAEEWICAVSVSPDAMPGVGDTQMEVLREIEAAIAKTTA